MNKRRLKDIMKSRRDLKRLQMLSGDRGPNRVILASAEGNMSVVETKDGIGKGSRAARSMQSTLQSLKRAVEHEDGLRGRHYDGRGLSRERDTHTEEGSETRR